MSQSDFGTIDPNTKGGSELATDLNAWRDAVYSMHSGTTAPSYIATYMTWLDTNHADGPTVFQYDGADNIRLWTLDTTNNTFFFDLMKIGTGVDGTGNADEMVLSKDQAQVGLSILSADATGTSKVLFGSQTDVGAARVQWTESDDTLTMSSGGALVLKSSDTEAARFSTGQAFSVGTTSTIPGDGNTTNGASILAGGKGHHSTNGTAALMLNRNTSDGQLVQFMQGGNQEGNISVSGTTVSYNGGHLSRWSQGVEHDILRGSVMSNRDDMCVWAYVPIEYTDEDGNLQATSVPYTGDEPAGATVEVEYNGVSHTGKVKIERNEQLNVTVLSDVVGDKNVAGIFQNYDDEDEYGDFVIAMTGDFVIRIAEGVTVERGDLLMSAGDGTAMPQDDDIIRSCTVAKVTSTVVSETYPDGSYLIPCVLMAC